MTRPGTLDTWERRLSSAANVVPYLVLVLPLALTFAGDGAGPARGSAAGLLVLAGATGAWMVWWVTLHPAWHERTELMIGYFAGLMVLFALLQYRSPMFGFFAFAGYVHAQALLPGRWRIAGTAVTGAISATALYGGLPPTTWRDAAVYTLLIVVIVALAITFSSLGSVTTDQSRQRGQAVSELEELNARLQEALDENAGLHAQLLIQAREAGVLDERQRMAREIHDTLAQGLIGILTQVQAAEQAWDRPEVWQRHLGHAAQLARESLSEARRSVHAIRPEPLESARLPAALADVAQRWSTVSGVPSAVATAGEPRPLHPEVEVILLRAGQEALANVAKHARAGRVALTLTYTDDVAVLDVYDDGVGFDPAALPRTGDAEGGGFGLTAMRQRVAQVRGTLTIESEPGRGTALSVSVPAFDPAGVA